METWSLAGGASEVKRSSGISQTSDRESAPAGVPLLARVLLYPEQNLPMAKFV